jgi:hypothetical protein
VVVSQRPWWSIQEIRGTFQWIWILHQIHFNKLYWRAGIRTMYHEQKDIPKNMQPSPVLKVLLNGSLKNLIGSDTHQTYAYRFTDSLHRCPLPRESLWWRWQYRPLRLACSSRCRGTLNLDRQHKRTHTHLTGSLLKSIWSGSWIWTTSVFSSWWFLYVSVARGTSEPCDFESPSPTRLQALHVLRPCRRQPTRDTMDESIRVCENK